MVEGFIWLLFGALSGWIGYIYARSDQPGRLQYFAAIGMVGGVLGGMLARTLSATKSVHVINPDSAFSALIISGLFVGVYTLVLTSKERTG